MFPNSLRKLHGIGWGVTPLKALRFRMRRDDSRGKLLGERTVVTGAGEFAAAQACADA